MKTLLIPIFFSAMSYFAAGAADSTLAVFLLETQHELEQIQSAFFAEEAELYEALARADRALNDADEPASSDGKRLQALIDKVSLLEALQANRENYRNDLTKTRYRKGLELIKLLFEKILGLDHHFTALQTHQNVILLSNPNSFPEFQRTKNLLESRLKKKTSLRLPALLETNPYLSAAFSLVASVVGHGEPQEKEDDLRQIACILDFTVRMSNDLSIIYYETEYLKDGNRSLRQDCMTLFAEYVQPIGYSIPLDECRRTDDWERVYDKLSVYISSMEAPDLPATEESRRQAYRRQVNLEFSVDRLLDFIHKYSAFISQGEKYYQKFHTITSGYINEEVCSAKLPRQFSDLKKDIGLSIDKFNESYNIAELKGSRMKDLLYGLGE